MNGIERLRDLVAAGEKATQGEWSAGRSDMTSYGGFDGEPYKNVYGPDNYPHPSIPGETVPVSVARGETELCHENARYIAKAANARKAISDVLALVEAAIGLEIIEGENTKPFYDALAKLTSADAQEVGE